MRGLIVLIALVAIVSCELDLKSEWQNFKTKFSKSYHPSEEPSRFEIFKSNFAIAQQKTQNANGKTQYGVTKFSDLTSQEFKAFFTMHKTQQQQAQEQQQNKRELLSVSKVQDLPSYFDWRDKGAVTPVDDEGQCGSTWIWSATETLESVCFLAGYGLLRLSVQQVLDCDTNEEGCWGGYPYSAYDYIIANGIEPASAYPYTAQNGNCSYDKSKITPCLMDSWQNVTSDEGGMQKFLYQNSPLSACVDASSWQMYTAGVITADQCTDNLDHCIQLTGWDYMSNMTAWTVRNQWGTDWGVNGYLYLQFGANTCGITQVVTVPCVKDASGNLIC